DVFLLRRVEERPTLAETVTLEDSTDHFQVARGILGAALESWVIHVRAVILDVVNVEAELPEPQQVMKQLPDHTRERVSRREMQHDDFALALLIHRCEAILARGAPSGYPLQL